LPEYVGQDRGPSLLEGPEGARRTGHRVRGSQGTAPPRRAKSARAAERPASVSGHRTRRRDRLSRGVEGHGRADPAWRAASGPDARRVTTGGMCSSAETLRRRAAHAGPIDEDTLVY